MAQLWTVCGNGQWPGPEAYVRVCVVGMAVAIFAIGSADVVCERPLPVLPEKFVLESGKNHTRVFLR